MIELPLPMSLSLTTVSRSTEELTTSALAVFETGPTAERVLLRHLENASVSELLRIGEWAHRLGGAAWRIECKAHAKLLERQHAKRGRGKKDIRGSGVIAAARAVALATKSHPRTILKDAQLYRELLVHRLCQKIDLHEKSFYIIALSAPDPVCALRLIAQIKLEQPHFSTRQARQLVRKMQTNPGQANQGVDVVKDDDVLKAHLDHVSRTIRHRFIREAPKEELVTRYYRDWQEDIDWEREQRGQKRIN